jgi:hypothetical protein
MTIENTPTSGTVRIATVAEQLQAEHGRTSFIQPDPVEEPQDAQEEEVVEEGADEQSEDSNEDESAGEDTGEEDTSSDEDEDADEDNVEDSEPVKKTKGNGFEKSLERKMRKIARLERENQELRQGRAPQTIPTTYIPPVSESKPAMINFNGNVEAYVEAISQWSARQAIASVEQTKVQQASTQTWKQREAEYAKQVPEYFEVMEDFKHEMRDVQADEMNRYLADSDVGPQVWHYLAENRDELNRILAMNPYRRVGELGKIEDRFVSPAAPVKTPKVSKAPAPVSREHGAPPVTLKLTDPNLSQAEYREIRQKQLKKRY